MTKNRSLIFIIRSFLNLLHFFYIELSHVIYKCWFCVFNVHCVLYSINILDTNLDGEILSSFFSLLIKKECSTYNIFPFYPTLLSSKFWDFWDKNIVTHSSLGLRIYLYMWKGLLLYFFMTNYCRRMGLGCSDCVARSILTGVKGV